MPSLQLLERLTPGPPYPPALAHLEGVVTEDEEPSTWPDYLPRDWVDVPEGGGRIDPVSVLVWAVLVTMVVLAVIMFVAV